MLTRVCFFVFVKDGQEKEKYEKEGAVSHSPLRALAIFLLVRNV